MTPNIKFDFQTYKRTFNEFDVDKSGSIDKSEMLSFIKRLNEGFIEHNLFVEEKNKEVEFSNISHL